MDLIKKRLSIFEDEEDESLFSKEIEDIRRWSLGNQLRVGLFGREASVQTDVSELPTVKLLSETTATLIKEMDVLKKELAVKVKFIQAQYEARLLQEAESLYTQINDKVTSLERHHKEKVTVLRKSYQQQFTDAIQVIRASYQKYYMKRGEKVEIVASETGRVRDLTNEIEEQNFKIECISQQLKEYEERAFIQISSEAVEDPEKEWLKKDNEKLKDDIDSLHIDMEQLRTALDSKNERLEDLALNLMQLKSKAEDDKKACQKLSSENDQLKIQIGIEKESSRKKMKQLKQEMDKEIECMEKFRKNEKLDAEKRNEDQRLAEESRQREAMDTEKAILKAAARAAEKKTVGGEKDLVEKLDELQKTEVVQKKQIEKLRKQLDVSNKIWEKKFEILRQNFHAIKDEMFLRQTLQRQAATLHHASVSYTMDAPGCCQGKHAADSGFKRQSYAPAAPLPNIGTGGLQKMDRTDGTMGVRALSPLACSESQSETEDVDDEEFGGILPLPLPPPPNRQPHSTLNPGAL